MASFVLDMIGSSLHSLAGLILGSLGWGGIVALVAGLLLLLSLSARTLKFFSSPRGMAVTAAVMLAGLAWMWWMWGSKPVSGDTTPITYQPPIKEPQHAFTEPRPKAEASPVGAMVVQPDRAMVPASVTPLLPLVPVTGAVAVVGPSLPMPTTVRLPPIIVPLPRHTPPHRQAAETSTHTVTTQRGAKPAASPAGNAAAKAGAAQARPAPAKNSRSPGGGQASMAQQARAMAIRQSNQALMNSPAFNPWTMSPGSMGGGRGMATHPMGGMNHRGGGYR